MFQNLEDHALYVNDNKTFFYYKEIIEYIGHIISIHWVSEDGPFKGIRKSELVDIDLG